MRRTLFLILILMGNTIFLTAQTTVIGDVSGQTWTSAGNPYEVGGDLTVADGTTLNIEPGTEVYFQGDYNLIVSGVLNAVGTSDEMILFTTGGSATEFGGIRLDGADAGSIISYAIVENGVSSVNNHAGGIYINACSPTISFCEIRNCRASYGGGIFVMNSASPIIEWNVIHDNTASSLGGGIAFNGNGTGYLSIVRNNLIYDNENTNSSRGGGGITFYNGTYADIYNNVIFNNVAGSSVDGGGVYAYNSSNVINLWNNIVWGNTNAGAIDPQISSRVANTFFVEFCDVENGSTTDWTGFTYENNIDSDPVFINTTTGSEDFHLQIGSPCIDAGDPTSPIPMGGGSCIDIGAYEFIDNPLPVILSTFYTIFTDNLVAINWSTESESNNLGWNVYRGLTDDVAQTSQINPELIQGAGTTTEPTDYSFFDESNIENNTTYWYWLESASYGGETDYYGPVSLTVQFEEDTPITPISYGLHQNYPNPFNPSTSISFTLEEECDVELVILNIRGEQIMKYEIPSYQNAIVWDGKDANGKCVSSGVYFYKLVTDTKVYQKKMLLVK